MVDRESRERGDGDPNPRERGGRGPHALGLGNPEPHELGYGTWEDAETKLEAADFVALPAGSFEQHSYHLPLLTDAIEAERFVDELSKRGPEHGLDIVALPTLPYGVSEHHMRFAGTVTLRPDTYQRVIEDIGVSLSRHGVDRLLVVNHHGGNSDSLSIAADRLQREHGLQTHVVLPPFMEFARERLAERFGENWGHAGAYETSMIEHFAPGLVKNAEKRPQTFEDSPVTRQHEYFDDITEGGLGDPTDSDPAFVAEFVDEAVAGILERLRAEM